MITTNERRKNEPHRPAAHLVEPHWAAEEEAEGDEVAMEAVGEGEETSTTRTADLIRLQLIFLLDMPCPVAIHLHRHNTIRRQWPHMASQIVGTMASNDINSGHPQLPHPTLGAHHRAQIVVDIVDPIRNSGKYTFPVTCSNKFDP